MIEFANPFVIFEVAGVTMLLAFIALLICVASWVYTDAKAHQMSKGWSVFSSYITILYWIFIIYGEKK